MKNARTLFLWVILILVIGMIGCSSGGSSSGSSSTTTTTTAPANPMVGTWKNDLGGPSLTFNANFTGSISDGHPITSWTLSSTNLLNMTIPQPEVFQVTFTNTDKTKMTLHNLSPSDETTPYTKS